MSQTWIPDVDEETGLDNGYWIDNDSGKVFDQDLNAVDPYDRESDADVWLGATLNAYGQWIDADGGFIRNATADEVDANPESEDPSLTGGGSDNGVMGGRGTATDRLDYSRAGGRTPGHVDKNEGITLKDILSAGKDFLKDNGKDLLVGGAGLWALKDGMDRQKDYQPPKTASELLSSLPSNAPPAFSATQMAAWNQPLKTGNQLTRQYAADMPSSITPGVGMPGTKYAEGGEVEGPLSQTFDSSQMQGLVSGEGGGQDDMVPARLSPGEYVFDAESVSMLGDGDNSAGAKKLDELREKLRAHKRSAPDDEIAPPSQGALSYLGAEQ